VRHPLMLIAGLLVSVVCGGLADLHAQAAPPPFPTWHAGSPTAGAAGHQHGAWGTASLVPRAEKPATRTHTWTGLLIGGLVGGAATAVFLTGFCGDADTECGADEVGRAVALIAVPAAAAGALIGSLIRTER